MLNSSSNLSVKPHPLIHSTNVFETGKQLHDPILIPLKKAVIAIDCRPAPGTANRLQ